MGIIKKEDRENKSSQSSGIDKSMYVSNIKIDRNGKTWRKKQIWVREEFLGKLQIMNHFNDKKTKQMVDEALDDYLKKNWDDSMAARKMVENSEK